MPTGADYTDFEQPLRELDQRAAAAAPADRAAFAAEREQLQARIFANLSAVDRVRLARHPARPQTPDYLAALFHDFLEIHGDRHFGDDSAVIAGLGYFKRQPVAPMPVFLPVVAAGIRACASRRDLPRAAGCA